MRAVDSVAVSNSSEYPSAKFEANFPVKSTGSGNVLSLVSRESPSESPPGNQVSDKEVLTKAVSRLNEMVAPWQNGLEFAMDNSTDKMVVRVVNTETGELIRQIPSEHVMKVSKAIEDVHGLVVDEQR